MATAIVWTEGVLLSMSTVQLERKLIRIISHGDNFMKLDGIEVLGVTDAQMGV